MCFLSELFKEEKAQLDKLRSMMAVSAFNVSNFCTVPMHPLFIILLVEWCPEQAVETAN